MLIGRVLRTGVDLFLIAEFIVEFDIALPGLDDVLLGVISPERKP